LFLLDVSISRYASSSRLACAANGGDADATIKQERL
jgi:hypothetical protein